MWQPTVMVLLLLVHVLAEVMYASINGMHALLPLEEVDLGAGDCVLFHTFSVDYLA